MGVVRPGTPSDVVDAEGYRENGRSLGKHVTFEPGEAGVGRVAALAGVDETYATLREAHERVVLDDLGVTAGGGDAVAQEGERVAVAQGEIGAPESSHGAQRPAK